jgi:outer membrane protein assembly factor BamB
MLRKIIAALLLTQCIILLVAIVMYGRFAGVFGNAVGLFALAALAIYGCAIAGLLGRLPRRPALTALSLTFAVLLTVRFYVPQIIWAVERPRTASDLSADLVALLREMAAAQEQYRLRSGSYASSTQLLEPWVTVPGSVEVEIRSNTNEGWSALVRRGRKQCAIWVRDSTLRMKVAGVEGSPSCGSENRRRYQQVRTVAWRTPTETGFSTGDVHGHWLQHRVDATRSAVTSNAGRGGDIAWSATISGEIRSPVAIAGNQVFVGAHGNGEFAALSLDSGKVGWRIRAPNWIHHEPVVTGNLVIVGIGNNESASHRSRDTGSPPNGIVAYDRLTGEERWRAYTRGAVMSSPVIHDSTIAVITSVGDVMAWRIGGRELWRTALTAPTPMANPALRDTIMFVGLEPAVLCAVHIITGQQLFCQTVKHGWAGGHSSPAVAGDVVLLAIQHVSRPRFSRAWWRAVGHALVGIIDKTTIGDPTLVAFDATTGSERWRLALGPGRYQPEGHNAGTPVIEKGIAYVPVPTSGNVVAVQVDSGRMLWSAPIRPSRGSVIVADGRVFAAAGSDVVILDARDGKEICRQQLPAISDRAGPTVAGGTAVLTLRPGIVIARPLDQWLACRVSLPTGYMPATASGRANVREAALLRAVNGNDHSGH